MHRVALAPLTAAAFAAFGRVLDMPGEPGRRALDETLTSRRAAARPSLSLRLVAPAAGLPLRATRMERHAHSSQTFIALNGGDWLVAVAPHGADGWPDVAQLRAFRARPGQSVTYAPDVWHLPLLALDRPTSFAMLIWRDGTAADEEFVDIAPVLITLAEARGAA